MDYSSLMNASNLSRNCVSCIHASGSHAPGGRDLSPTGHVMVAVYLGFIGAFGFVNNALVLLLFCRHKPLRSPINCMLVSISLSDLLVCVLGTPFSFAASARGRWLIGAHGCVWYGFINSFLGKISPEHQELHEQPDVTCLLSNSCVLHQPQGCQNFRVRLDELCFKYLQSTNTIFIPAA